MLPATPNEKPVFAELDGDLWWLNQDSRGGVWINGREKKEGETAASASDAEPVAETFQPSAPTSPAAPESSAAIAAAAPDAPRPNDTLVAVRLLLKETKTGSVAGKLERVAEELGKSPEDLLAALDGRRPEGAGEGARETGLRRARWGDHVAESERQGRTLVEREGLEICRRWRR